MVLYPIGDQYKHVHTIETNKMTRLINIATKTSLQTNLSIVFLLVQYLPWLLTNLEQSLAVGRAILWEISVVTFHLPLTIADLDHR